MQPWIALAGEHDSNPDLRTVNESPESIAAILVNAPVNYDLDAVHFALVPNVRYSNRKGYASLGSDYVHLNASAQFSSDLQKWTWAAGVQRDSSLVHGGESVNGVGVRTDTRLAGLDWQRSLAERLQSEIDLSWIRATYDQSSQQTGLVDYRYISAAPSIAYALDERDTGKVLTNAGKYDSLNGVTESKNIGFQLGLDRRLSEIWTLSASAGYARSDNSEQVFFGPYLLGTVDSRQNGAVYSASVVRKSEVFALTASASRTFTPSGFGYLSRQDAAGLEMDYNYSERWTFVAKANFQKTGYPLSTGGYSALRFFASDLAANWHWTPEWTISLHGNWVSERYQSLSGSAASTGVSLQVSRQFYRIDL